MAYWLGNGVDRWYDIYLETRLLGRSRLSEDEKAEFFTKTERKKCKNTQNILLDGCYLLFEQYLLENTSVDILNPYREIGQSLEESP